MLVLNKTSVEQESYSTSSVIDDLGSWHANDDNNYPQP